MTARLRPATMIATMAAAISALASALPVPTAAAPLLTLRDGDNISISVPADQSRLAFDLVGGIWIMDPRDGQAEPVTAITEYSRHPAFSPDGRWIAFESVRDKFHQIMLISPAGGTPKQLTFGDYHHLSPTWAPDGRRIVIASNRAGTFDLWALDVETFTLHQLTSGPNNDREPFWNADGTVLTFVRDDGIESSIMALAPGTKPTALLTEPARIHGPSWRPGNRVLTYVRQLDGRSQLRMLLLSTPAITKPITQGEYVHPYPARWLDRENFLYAADGRIKRREFGSRTAEAVPFEARIEVEQTNVSVRELDFEDNTNRAVNGITGLSPIGDGRLIVSALGDLWELNADGTLLRQLTNDAFVDTHPAVSPDGRTLAFISDRGDNLQLWLMDIETRRVERLTVEEGIVLYPVWNQTSDALAFLVANHASATQLTLKRIDLQDRTVIVLADQLSNSAPPLLDGDDWSLPSMRGPDSDLTEVPLTWRPLKPEGRFIIRAGRIFDGIGPGYVTDHEILIEENRIVEIRPWTEANSGEQVIDATRYTVIPGLIDLSVQQAYASDESLGRAWLAAGVTTIRETVWNLPEATERHESWLSGRRIGPRLFMALNSCAGSQDATSSAVIDRMMAGLSRPYVALIELCPALGSEVYRRLIAEAHAAGLPVATSVPFPALLLGADELRLGSARGGDDPMMLRPDGFTYGDVANIVGKLDTIIVSRLAVAGQNAGPELFRAISRGARVVTGSAAPLTPYGQGLQAELRLLADTGLQPFQVLKMTSLDAARVLGAGKDLGSIQAGKLADLVIVDGDPLTDIGDTANVVITIINGRVYRIADLKRPGNGSVGKLYN